jgi:hypothetical protein
MRRKRLLEKRDLALDRDLCAPERTEKPWQARLSGPLLRLFFNVLSETRQRAAEREIERFLQRNGGQFSDEIEREISRKLGFRGDD